MPQDVKNVSFLGLCTYYRRFVPSFADVARPLHKLTEKGQPFMWTRECDSSFHRLKEALASDPVLAYPEIKDLFVLDTDASNVGIGAVLSQVHQGDERVITYYSQTLSKPERNCCTTERKLLAIVKKIDHFHPNSIGGTNGIHWLLKTVCCNHWWKLPDLGRVKWQLVLPKVLRTSVLKHPSGNPPCSRYAPRSGSIRQGIRQGRELRVPLDLLIGHTQDSTRETGQNV